VVQEACQIFAVLPPVMFGTLKISVKYLSHAETTFRSYPFLAETHRYRSYKRMLWNVVYHCRDRNIMKLF